MIHYAIRFKTRKSVLFLIDYNKHSHQFASPKICNVKACSNDPDLKPTYAKTRLPVYVIRKEKMILLHHKCSVSKHQSIAPLPIQSRCMPRLNSRGRHKLKRDGRNGFGRKKPCWLHNESVILSWNELCQRYSVSKTIFSASETCLAFG